MPAGVIGNILTSEVINQATNLQIAVGVVLRYKSLIPEVYYFSVRYFYN